MQGEIKGLVGGPCLAPLVHLLKALGKSSSKLNSLCQHTSLGDLQGLQTMLVPPQGYFLQHFHFSPSGTQWKREAKKIPKHRQIFPFALQGRGGGTRFPLLVFPHPSPLGPAQHFLPLHGYSTQTFPRRRGRCDAAINAQCRCRV